MTKLQGDQMWSVQTKISLTRPAIRLLVDHVQGPKPSRPWKPRGRASKDSFPQRSTVGPQGAIEPGP